MQETPVTPVCAGLLDAREHAVIGISPFNSYFSEEKIEFLIRWAKEKFKSFHIYVPDGPAVFTLKASGYTEARAIKKARRQGSWLANKIGRAMAKLGIEEQQQTELLLNSSRLDGLKAYQSLLDRAYALYETDAWFREGCIKSSEWVLNGKVEDADALTPEVLNSAVRYFLAELPFFIDSAQITGASSSLFVYHQCPAFVRQLLNEKRGEIVSERQGFLVATSIND